MNYTVKKLREWRNVLPWKIAYTCKCKYAAKDFSIRETYLRTPFVIPEKYLTT